MASICAPYSVGIHQFTLSASIGIALYDGGSVSGSQLMRSEEHTSELQSLMRISYAVFCLKKKNKTNTHSTLEKKHTKQTARTVHKTRNTYTNKKHTVKHKR